ncbi:hypothetical protein QR680_016990 [Steinernema hermaphroditum]|uniref:Uncharacterized protein n=1 Tax=Steinernema hermaphroditum TaxID=289476 RepID=A0AA39HCY0_9BILA|nr:hypothetical protein QR680_016990 [Steinernema hermaphroditum]
MDTNDLFYEGNGQIVMSIVIGFNVGFAFGGLLLCLHAPFTNCLARRRAKVIQDACQMDDKNEGAAESSTMADVT